MNKTKLFKNIGLAVAREVVPGVVLVEAGMKGFSGKDKAAAVDKIVDGSLQIGALSSEKLAQLLQDNDFILGKALVRDGNVLIMKAVDRL
jgi:hypothetical protein